MSFDLPRPQAELPSVDDAVATPRLTRASRELTTKAGPLDAPELQSQSAATANLQEVHRTDSSGRVKARLLVRDFRQSFLFDGRMTLVDGGTGNSFAE